MRARKTHIEYIWARPIGPKRYAHTFCGIAYHVINDTHPKTTSPETATCRQCQRGFAKQERLRAQLKPNCDICGTEYNIMPNRVGGKHECWDCRVARTGQIPRYRWRSGDMSI